MKILAVLVFLAGLLVQVSVAITPLVVVYLLIRSNHYNWAIIGFIVYMWLDNLLEKGRKALLENKYSDLADKMSAVTSKFADEIAKRKEN